MDGIDDTWRQLSSLPSLTSRGFIKNIVWLAVYPSEICIEQGVVLESGWRLLANSNSQHSLTLKKHSRSVLTARTGLESLCSDVAVGVVVVVAGPAVLRPVGQEHLAE